MPSEKGRSHDNSRRKAPASSFQLWQHKQIVWQRQHIRLVGHLRPAYTYSQVNPDDFSIHSSDLSRGDTTTTTTHNSSSGNPANSLPSSAAQNSASQSVKAPPAEDDPTSSAFSSWSPSATQRSSHSSQPTTNRKSAADPFANMLNRRRKQQQQAAEQAAPKPNPANSAIPQRAAPPATFINLPKFTKRNDGTDALPSPASPAIGNPPSPVVAAAAGAVSPPALIPPATRNARFLPDPQMQPPANTFRPERSTASTQLASRLVNRQGGLFQNARSKRRVSDDEASNSDAAGSPRGGSAIDLDSATDEGDSAQADEIAAIRPFRGAAGHLPPSSASANDFSFEATSKSGTSGSSGERPLSELLQDKLSTLQRTSSIAALAQLRRVSGSGPLWC